MECGAPAPPLTPAPAEVTPTLASTTRLDYRFLAKRLWPAASFNLQSQAVALLKGTR